MNDILKIVQALEDSNILLKGVTKIIKNKTKEQKGSFQECYQELQDLVCQSMHVLAGKRIERADYRNKVDF